MITLERLTTSNSQKKENSEIIPVSDSRHYLVNGLKKFSIILMTTALISCSQNETSENNSLEEQTSVFREKILNQRIMLDDALKQLELEKKQVRVLEGQIELNKEQLEQSQVEQKMVNDYQNLQNALSRRNRELKRKEKQYDEVNLKLDRVVAYLNENNIDLVTNELGDIEDIKIGNNSSGVNAQYDSLLNVLDGERKNFDKTVKNLNRLVNAYKREALRWKDKFNKRGLFISNLNSNFKVNFTADSTKQQGALFVAAELLRESGKAKKGSVQVKITCNPPNGNIVDLYNNVISYGKKDTVIPLENVNTYQLEASGVHQFIVYLGTEEVYYEDIELNLP